MKVHFSASVRGAPKHLLAYNAITDTIDKDGHQLVRDWLKAYQEPKKAPQNYSDEEWEDISTTTLAAVLEADVVILEVSVTSFSIGYQAAWALAHKKPVLILFDSRYQQYIIDPSTSLKRSGVYHNNEELRRIVHEFLIENDIDSKNMRFNMVLDRETYKFLNWESIHTGKTKGQIIRDVLRQQIKNKKLD